MGPPNEIAAKLAALREVLTGSGADGVTAVRLRGAEWFAWATGGGSSTLALAPASEVGIAEIVVTPTEQWVLTNDAEAARLRDEEVPEAFAIAPPTLDGAAREGFVRALSTGGRVASDLPRGDELPLPRAAHDAKRALQPTEIYRYRRVGARAAEALTEVLTVARASWTERELAGAVSDALHARGLEPARVLVAGERRLPLYRHPIPKKEPLGRIATVHVSARGDGLYVSLARFVVRGELTSEEHARHSHLRTIEGRVLDECTVGVPLAGLFAALPTLYAEHGYAGAEHACPQGGTTGYAPRDSLVRAESDSRLLADSAFVIHPSVPAATVEDTFLLHADGALENLTFDPRWPAVLVAGRPRPLPLESEA